MSRELDERSLGTADIASAAEPSPARQESPRPEQAAQQADGERLAALFDAAHAEEFRTQWAAVQTGFVDDPRRAVQRADELVAQVMKSLAGSFARQRQEIEAAVGGEHDSDTENLRQALRRYRSFFERLLTL